MAASSAVPSPTTQSVEGKEKGTAMESGGTSTPHDNENSSADKCLLASKATTTTTPQLSCSSSSPQQEESSSSTETIPSYEGSENSSFYVEAKKLLDRDDFEEALSMIEEGIGKTRECLAKHHPNEEDENFITFHESMAPFHYLYGTTLLYSIEESSSEEAMMTAASTNANGEDAEGGDAPADAPPATEVGSDMPEDMQIAWENLETARAIMENMKTSDSVLDKQVTLGLGQVHLRLGDLQRMNGRHSNAIDDYTKCLGHFVKSNLHEQFSRKIADVHYNLGLAFLLRRAQTNVPDGEGKHEDDGKYTGESKRTGGGEASAEDRQRWLCQSFSHFLECAKTLTGQIANLCGQEPSNLLSDAESDVPKFKTTGEEDQILDHPSKVRLKLRRLRQSVEKFKPEDNTKQVFEDLKCVMDEIQEIVDEAENSDKGVHEVVSMKEEISSAVAGLADEPSSKAGASAGATTAPGPSTSTELPEKGTSSIGFPSSAAALTATALPLMAVKKKRKHPNGENATSSKLAKAE